MSTSLFAPICDCLGKYRPATRFLLGILGILLLLPLGSAQALVHFDFDQKYFIHQNRQVWDFSIVRPDSIYHIFYHTIHEETPHASYADTIWHSTSKDLKHWVVEDPILTVGQGYWDEGALWAPDVFRDPVNEKWMLAYTACDSRMNQRIAMASSDDLYTWTKSPFNPTIEPDPDQYVWNADNWWSDFRDPFVWESNGVFQILVTAKKVIEEGTGVLYHGVSTDLVNWIDLGPIFVNDGEDSWRVLESPQYKILNDKYYLFFGEYDTGGISAVPADLPGQWTMEDRIWVDYGYAPEVDEFDPGTHIFSRIAPFDVPATGLRNYVVRLDTLQIDPDGHVEPFQPHPLGENWASWSGTSNLAQPTFGDNSASRGAEPAGTVGNGYYGSKEYYQGPLSGRGSPGTQLGDAATGILTSHQFRITGTRMTLLVGGGHYPETCYVALVDASTDTVLFKETGNNQETMTLRQWDLAALDGRPVYLTIVDQENQEFGHINVDEIREDNLQVSATPHLLPDVAVLDHHAYPNPFNPRTQIMFDLPGQLEVMVNIHDLRGSLIWSSGSFQGMAGSNSIQWDGRTAEGAASSAGAYLYSIHLNGQVAGSGKISLVK